MDEILMRLIDVLLAIPPLLLAMIILFTLGLSRINVILQDPAAGCDFDSGL